MVQIRLTYNTIYQLMEKIQNFKHEVPGVHSDVSNGDNKLIASVFENVLDAVILISSKGIILRANKAVRNVLGYHSDDIVGKNVTVLMPSHYSKEHDQFLLNYLNTGITKVIGIGREVAAQHKEGFLIPMELSVSVAEQEEDIFFIGVLRDIGERKRHEKEMQINNEIMHAVNSILSNFINSNTLTTRNEIFNNPLEELLRITKSEYGFIGEILVKDNSSYLKTYSITDISWSQDTRRYYADNFRDGMEFTNLNSLFGVTIRTGEVVIANSPSDDPRSSGLPPGHPDLNAYLGLPIYAGSKLLGMAGISNRKEGYNQDLVDLVKPILGAIGSLIAGYQFMESKRDAEKELYRAQEKLKKMAHLDIVTDIPNRLLLIQKLEQMYYEKNSGLTVLFIDIDHFKDINDTYGHAAGDDALKKVGKAIQDTVRPGDAFGRYGGEEFVIGLPETNLLGGKRLAERLQEAIKTIKIGNNGKESKEMTISVGVAEKNKDNNSLDELLQQADKAVYLAKDSGRNCIQIVK